MWKSSGGEHAETRNAQNASEECRRRARLVKRPMQGQEVSDPQDEDHQVEAVFNGARRPDLGEALDHFLRAGREKIRAHEDDHYHEDKDEEDAADDTGEATPSQKVFPPPIVCESFIICLLRSFG